jgi:hypothetical protein
VSVNANGTFLTRDDLNTSPDPWVAQRHWSSQLSRLVPGWAGWYDSRRLLLTVLLIVAVFGMRFPWPASSTTNQPMM